MAAAFPFVASFGPYLTKAAVTAPWELARCYFLTNQQKSEANVDTILLTIVKLIAFITIITVLEAVSQAVRAKHRMEANIGLASWKPRVRSVVTESVSAMLLLVFALAWLSVKDDDIKWPLHTCPFEFGVVMGGLVNAIAGLKVTSAAASFWQGL
jgi:hypothetical protein